MAIYDLTVSKTPTVPQRTRTDFAASRIATTDRHLEPAEARIDLSIVGTGPEWGVVKSGHHATHLVCTGIAVDLSSFTGKVKTFPAATIVRKGAAWTRDPRELAASLGAKPGRKLSAPEARAVLNKISQLSLDVFPDLERAGGYLSAENFAGTGKNALELVKGGGAATVLGRLDELRFGPQG